jgi:SagB-type dehydrogenase family enzyme
MTSSAHDGSPVELPKPKIRAGASLERALSLRRSRRTFADSPVSAEDLSQLLWAAQGVTAAYGLRTAPSAGSLHPLRLYAVVGNIDGLAPGAYRFDAATHSLEQLETGDRLATLREASGHQECLGAGAVDLIVAGDPAGPVERYGERGLRYLYMEAGHVAQNVYLQVTALGLSTTAVAAFDDDAMARGAHLGDGEVPLYVMPVGHSR